MRRLFSLFFALTTLLASAQMAPPKPEPQVNPDRTVTFRYPATSATRVEVSIDLAKEPFPMTRDAAGDWTYTTEALAPAIYSYRFQVDGRPALDPHNPNVKQSLTEAANGFLVPGDTPNHGRRLTSPTAKCIYTRSRPR